MSSDRPFGDPRTTNAATISAAFDALSLAKELEKYKYMLCELGPPTSESFVQSTISNVEISVESISHDLDLITRPEAASAVAKARSIVLALNETVAQWRTRFPNSLPFKINNGASFVVIFGNCLLIPQN
jgi:hypothetical protein